MRIAGLYSFNNGQEVVESRYPILLGEIKCVIDEVDASQHKTKVSKEKTMRGRKLFSPVSINNAFKIEFEQRGWSPVRVSCDYSTSYYVSDYSVRSETRGAFREMDFVKSQVGIEVQFGKYAFMVYNVCAKMTIFKIWVTSTVVLKSSRSKLLLRRCRQEPPISSSFCGIWKPGAFLT